MARTRKPQFKDHTFRMVEGNYELLIVGRGRNAYLWAGSNAGTIGCTTFTGQQALRSLARAILRAVPPRK